MDTLIMGQTDDVSSNGKGEKKGSGGRRHRDDAGAERGGEGSSRKARDDSGDAPPARTGTLRKMLAAAVFGGLAFGASALGRPVSKPRVWYRSLFKSKATPPSWVFGPVWTALYSGIAYSGYRTWTKPDSPERTRALRLWGLQMALNASWSPLFFGAHRPKTSAVVAGAMVPTIAAYALTARKVDRPAAALMIPYLGWSAFAAYLNAQIVRKNAFRL